jgi:hypothetical protein
LGQIGPRWAHLAGKFSGAPLPENKRLGIHQAKGDVGRKWRSQAGAWEREGKVLRMKYLYVDNFRGFKDTFLPIRDVNFFVGENSTGKTSILSLLKLISSPRFWFNLEFETDETKLGHFDDIVSVGATDRSYFCIGMIDNFKNEGEENDTIKSYLMTFIKIKRIAIHFCLYF